MLDFRLIRVLMQSANAHGETATSLALTKLVDNFTEQSRQLLRALCSGPLHPPGVVHAAIDMLDDSNQSHQVSVRSANECSASEQMHTLSVSAGSQLFAC